MSNELNKIAVRSGFARKLVHVLKKAKHKHYDMPFSKLPKDVRQGHFRSAMESGADSVFLLPFNMFGKSKTKKRLAKHFSIPALKLDTALGAKAQKVTPLKKMFTIKEKVPVSIGKNKIYKETERPSALAPVTKTMDTVVPFAGAMAISDAIEKWDKKRRQEKMKNTVTLEKKAAVKLAEDMIRLSAESTKLAQANTGLEKMAKAQKLVFKQASLGICDLPQSYEELLEKAASLATQDLDIVEKALSFQLGDVGIGKLATASLGPSTPEEQFTASVLGED